MEFISSKKRVPSLACSNNPGLSAAPVKAPFTEPNNMDSNNDSGNAAQF